MLSRLIGNCVNQLCSSRQLVLQRCSAPLPPPWWRKRPATAEKWSSSDKGAKSWGEGARGSAVAWPRPPAPGHRAALGLKAAQGPEVWLRGGDGVKPPELGSSSVTSMIVSQSCPGWKEMLEKPHWCNSNWDKMEKQGPKSLFWPSQGAQGASKTAFPPGPAHGWCGRWCFQPSSCPYSEPIYPYILGALNTQRWESLVTG